MAGGSFAAVKFSHRESLAIVEEPYQENHTWNPLRGEDFHDAYNARADDKKHQEVQTPSLCPIHHSQSRCCQECSEAAMRANEDFSYQKEWARQQAYKLVMELRCGESE